jgi:predicted transcriptional regulator of viral defense system
MQTATEKIIDAGFNNQILSETDLARLFGGTAARRYGLVNKALHKGDLINLRRGLYIMAPKYRTTKFSQFMLANHIVAHSYVSLESALSYHGWIPEKVSSVFSIIPSGRNRTFATELCDFEYNHIVTNQFEFLTGVKREGAEYQSFLMATPLRALADYVYLRKPEHCDVEFLQQSLRIELETIKTIKTKDIEQMLWVFSTKRVIKFLQQLKQEIKNL